MAPGHSQGQSPADTRAAILRAAVALMGDRSYAGTPVPEVAARAGVAAGTIYRHFSGKQALVNAVYRECKLAMGACLNRAAAGAGSHREVFHRLWRGLWEFSRKQRDAFRFLELHRHQPYLDTESQAVARSVSEDIADFVRTAQAAGAMRPGPPEMLIALAFGAFVGLVKEAEAGHTTLDETAVAASEDAVWGMLRA